MLRTFTRIYSKQGQTNRQKIYPIYTPGIGKMPKEVLRSLSEMVSNEALGAGDVVTQAMKLGG